MTQNEEPRSASLAEAGERIAAVRAVFDAYATMSLATIDAGEPWIGKIFFADDEPEPGRLDLCAALLASSRKLALVSANPRVAFLVASDTPDCWVQGVGDAELVTDDADAEAIAKSLYTKSAAAEPFLSRIPWRGVRIHVRRLKITDIRVRPPVAELSFE